MITRPTFMVSRRRRSYVLMPSILYTYLLFPVRTPLFWYFHSRRTSTIKRTKACDSHLLFSQNLILAVNLGQFILCLLKWKNREISWDYKENSFIISNFIYSFILSIFHGPSHTRDVSFRSNILYQAFIAKLKQCTYRT